MGKYESPKEVVEGIWRSDGMRGRIRSSSSVEASVGMVGLRREAAEDAGSREAILLRIEGMETLESVLNGHDGGESGDTGLDRSILARGVGACSCRGVCTGVALALDNGDFFMPEDLPSLPFPSTVLRRDPFLLRFPWA